MKEEGDKTKKNWRRQTWNMTNFFSLNLMEIMGINLKKKNVETRNTMVDAFIHSLILLEGWIHTRLNEPQFPVDGLDEFQAPNPIKGHELEYFEDRRSMSFFTWTDLSKNTLKSPMNREKTELFREEV